MFGFKWFGHQQLIVFFRANLHLLLRGHLFEGSFLFHNVIVCPSQDSPVYCTTTILLKISGLFTFSFKVFLRNKCEAMGYWNRTPVIDPETGDDDWLFVIIVRISTKK